MSSSHYANTGVSYKIEPNKAELNEAIKNLAHSAMDWGARQQEVPKKADLDEVERRHRTAGRQRTDAARKTRRIKQLGITKEKKKKERHIAMQTIAGYVTLLASQNLMNQELFTYLEAICNSNKTNIRLLQDILKQMAKKKDADKVIAENDAKIMEAKKQIYDNAQESAAVAQAYNIENPEGVIAQLFKQEQER